MNRKYRYLFVAFIAVSVAGIAALAIFHYWRVNAPALTFSGAKGVGVKIDNVHYTSARQGRVEWELFAVSATRYKTGDLTALDTIRLVFHVKGDVSPYTLTAKEALYREGAGEVDATGGVTVTSGTGYSLRTERLKYNAKAARITSDDRVEIITNGMKVTGAGLLIEIDRGKLFLFKDVRAVFKDNTV